MDPADYMLAICGSDTLRELASPGKSGSCFFVTQDDRFMIKTVKKAEMKVIRSDNLIFPRLNILVYELVTCMF